MKQLDLTTGLDLAGLALIAAGGAYGTWPYIHGFALVVAGGVVIAGSWLAGNRPGA